MHLETLPLSNNLMWNDALVSASFPIQLYINELEQFPGRQISLHWHRESELFMVNQGTAELQIGNHTEILSAGEGIYINSNVLHSVTLLSENTRCLCPNIVFSPEFLAPITSMAYQKYIQPITENAGLSYFLLKPAIAWQQDILTRLCRIFSILRAYQTPVSLHGPYPEDFVLPHVECACYEMRVHTELSHIWECICSHASALPEYLGDTKELRIQTRMRHMLLYIAENYIYPLTLNDIAAAASISKSEASRYFQAYLNVSPVEYLLRYRISSAQKILSNSHLPVQDICAACGFHSASYFAKIFKERVGMTPAEYRRQFV